MQCITLSRRSIGVLSLAGFIAVSLISSTAIATPAQPSAPSAATAPSASNEQSSAIATFTAKMQQHQGFFSFYHDQHQGNIYLKVPRAQTQFIFQTSLPWGLGSNDIGLDRGQLGATRLASFLIEGDKVLLQQHNTKFRANSDNAAERASIEQAFASSVIAGFKVVAADADAVLIDYTPFLLSDTHGVVQRLAQSKQGNYKVNGAQSVIYPARSKAFADNTELEAKLTFSGQASGSYVNQVAADANQLTLHLHHSFIRLPDANYQPRQFHPQSGFWSEAHQDYAAPLGQPLTVQYIPRHRLSATNPIIYYLDPGVPEPVRTALLDGAKWWAEAFAEVGYPDGFQVRELPADADPMDVRYNVIQWVHRATRGWSYGASIIDPRTGEIIKGHVTLGSLRVRQDMLIAQGLLAPYQDHTETVTQQQLLADIEAMALARIRQLSAHEIGHTLGIAHNFAASSHDRASVMDYPHPLVSLSTNEQGLSLAGAYTEGLGIWDKQVVAYGYGDGDLAKVIEQNRRLGLSFISDRDARAPGGAHPDAHLWDNGSDAVTELERILAVRATALQQFGLANLAAGQPLSQLQNVLVPVYLLHRYQVEAAVKMLAGVHYDYSVKGEPFRPVRAVNASQQQRALQVLMKTLQADTLRLPTAIHDLLTAPAYGEGYDRERFTGLTGLLPDTDSMAASSARFTLDLLLQPQRLERLAQQHSKTPSIPSISTLLAALADTTLTPAQAASADTLTQRLAFETLTAVAQVYQQQQLSAVVKAPLWQFLQQQQQQWQQAPASAHQAYVVYALEQLLEHQRWPVPAAAALPPGSPI
ncbi:zinc-dependent metalloprotease [Pseudidiomarina sp. GXY010]|uniref:Zinc-dependent metalloprotease n=1 Tax=Pseudidiomarina fusca TaxID=2965078 RepID=A0ABU3KUT5_9GAMM|nr:zinc-dependent metalloprotease [Pseudidiomarina sp. GXY010]MDT7525254.1 zinc-dependent metalloprotease [Pseudidiomarina sp. GXY010]